ncbi:MAG TPA: helix-turn-helix transcriptional regulator [Gaiellaceae bacterium]|nr:helix-turn-helix transcriptional regulator [Gaiellaceae bacterium]
MRTIRAETFDLALREPGPGLRSDVLVLEDYAEHALAPVRQRHLPGTFVPLVLNFGPRYRVRQSAGWSEHASFAGGLGEAVAVTESPGTALCVQVNLTPLGARRILGVPMHELAGRVVSLADVLGRDAARLEERLAEAPGAPARLALVESFLAGRLDAAEPARPDAARAWSRLEETGGGLRIGALAAELRCSRRHLAALFRDHVGVPPKAAARLLRFERALPLVEAGVAGAEVARRCGYADQAHLVNEFRRFAGTTPAALVRERPVPFLQDAGPRTA